MPRSFELCVKHGGKVVTKKLKNGQYMRLCKTPRGQWVAGEVRKKGDTAAALAEYANRGKRRPPRRPRRPRPA